MNVAMWQQSNILPHGGMFEKNATGLLSYLRVSVYFKLSLIMKRSWRSVAWEHFVLKNDLVHCQHCEAVCKYNLSMTQMMYHLNNAHPTLVKGGASCSQFQPSINSVLACTWRSCDAQRAEKITQGICKFIEMDMLPISVV